MQDHSIKILIADDHELFRKGIISLLLNEEWIKIIGEANDGKDLINKCYKLHPDLIITDISMPELSGLEAARILSEEMNDIKIIFLSMYGGEDYIYHCIKSGGSALVHKNVSKKELLNVIKSVIKGKKYFGYELSDVQIRKILSSYQHQTYPALLASTDKLTHKEEEVLLLIAEGLTSNEIAERLSIGKRTVDHHRTNIMQKLNLKSFPQLMKYALSFAELSKK